MNKFYYSSVTLLSVQLNFSKRDIDELCFVELMEFVERALETKNAKEQKEIVDNILFINMMHSDGDGLNAILQELKAALHGSDRHYGLDRHEFNPTAGALL